MYYVLLCIIIIIIIIIPCRFGRHAWCFCRLWRLEVAKGPLHFNSLHAKKSSVSRRWMGTPDSNPRYLLNWCFYYTLANIISFKLVIWGSCLGRGFRFHWLVRISPSITCAPNSPTLLHSLMVSPSWYLLTPEDLSASPEHRRSKDSVRPFPSLIFRTCVVLSCSSCSSFLNRDKLRWAPLRELLS